MVLDYLEQFNLSKFKVGCTEVSGKDVFVNAMEQITVAEEEAVWESHEKHIDIHFLVEGNEIIKYAEEYKMKVEVPYNEEKDCTLFSGYSGLNVNCPNGGFVIFFPEEIHKL
jgi:YhcH/YjgK/YiaL family protein